MQMQAISKSLMLGAAAGMIGYLITTAGRSEKSRLKRRTAKAVNAVGAVMDSVADFIR